MGKNVPLVGRKKNQSQNYNRVLSVCLSLSLFVILILTFLETRRKRELARLSQSLNLERGKQTNEKTTRRVPCW